VTCPLFRRLRLVLKQWRHAKLQWLQAKHISERTAGRTDDVRHLAPEAGYLLTAAFPYLTLAQADAILTKTEGPGGGFLDDGSAFGVYSRLDLYRAVEEAISLAPQPSTTTE
jgi:hypothetical protein